MTETFCRSNGLKCPVLDREFYKMTADAVRTSHEYYDNMAIEAAVLSTKHYWATATNAPPEIIEDPKGILTLAQVSAASQKKSWSHLKHLPPPAYCLLLLVGSELMLTLFKRALKVIPSPRARGSLRLSGW